MKPLIRWTSGNMSPEGVECLIHSVKEWTRLYGETFDKAVCFNGKLPIELFVLEDDVEFIDQSEYINSLPHKPFDTFWKFFPPRMRLDAYEIIIDNDVVIYDKPPAIDRFLNSTDVIVSSAHKHFYGQFSEVLDPGILINTGLIGLPPYFDLGLRLKRVFKLYPYIKLKEHCDDQGAFICATKGHLKNIPMEEIYVCKPGASFAPYKLGTHGTHFAGLNQGNSKYWNVYQNYITLTKF